MPRYFFHVINGRFDPDPVGVELDGMDSVRREAIRSAGSMLSVGEQLWKGDAWRMVVADEAGTIVFGLDFSTDRHGL